MSDSLHDSVKEWVVSSSLTETEIAEIAAGILTNPSIVTKDNSGGDTHYYSYSQMMEMFMCGAQFVRETGRKPKKYRANNAYGRMRLMEKGDTITFPYDKWNAARSAASKLKKEYGAKYVVTVRRAFATDDVLVTRIS